MKAYNSDTHYHVHIDARKEFPSLIDNLLETTLQDDSGKDLGKKFILKYDANARNPDVAFVPSKSSWQNLKEIRVTITSEVHRILAQQGLYVHRFGSAQSIDFYLEEDMFGFI